MSSREVVGGSATKISRTQVENVSDLESGNTVGLLRKLNADYLEDQSDRREVTTMMTLIQVD